MVAWTAYKQTDDYANTRHWVKQEEAVDGSLWAAFERGWRLATERAGRLHEQINPASDDERLANVPGAGAMGAVIEYRDAIRDTSP
jgi:hypothetical protein